MNLVESTRRLLSERALRRVMVLLDGDIIIKRSTQSRNHVKKEIEEWTEGATVLDEKEQRNGWTNSNHSGKRTFFSSSC